MNTDVITFVAELGELPQMLGWVCDKAMMAGFTGATLQKIEISMEEVLVNIISYAYAETSGGIEITATWQADDYLELTLKDRGLAFNPLLLEVEIDPDIPIEERQVGGLGIAIVKEFMDEINYKRDGVFNVLILRKYATF